MTKDIQGASGKPDRAGRATPGAASRLRHSATIPSAKETRKLVERALFLASGQDDPHSVTIIELVKAVRDANKQIVELADAVDFYAGRYAERCGQLLEASADPFPLATEAFHEALRRYPDAHGALIFLWGASGLGLREPTAAELERARQRIAAQGIEAGTAETREAGLGAKHESPVAESDAPAPPSTGN